MVLHGKLCGRVGRRRDYLKNKELADEAGSLLFSPSLSPSPRLTLRSLCLRGERLHHRDTEGAKKNAEKTRLQSQLSRANTTAHPVRWNVRQIADRINGEPMANASYQIVALPGDGIGPEVLSCAINVLKATSALIR